MKIKKCPHCVHYIHFDNPPGWTWCWNCGGRTDFSKVYSPEERLIQKFDAKAAHLQLPPLNSHLKTFSRVTLALALPLAVTMLLICNSFEISTVREAAKPFIRYEMNEDNFRMP